MGTMIFSSIAIIKYDHNTLYTALYIEGEINIQGNKIQFMSPAIIVPIDKRVGSVSWGQLHRTSMATCGDE